MLAVHEQVTTTIARVGSVNFVHKRKQGCANSIVALDVAVIAPRELLLVERGTSRS